MRGTSTSSLKSMPERRTRTNITIDLDELIAFLREVIREIDTGQFDKARKSVAVQLAIVERREVEKE